MTIDLRQSPVIAKCEQSGVAMWGANRDPMAALDLACSKFVGVAPHAWINQHSQVLFHSDSCNKSSFKLLNWNLIDDEQCAHLTQEDSEVPRFDRLVEEFKAKGFETVEIRPISHHESLPDSQSTADSVGAGLYLDDKLVRRNA
jgi:hypothetical protein